MLFPLLLLVTLATRCLASYDNACADQRVRRKIEDAIQEAIKMARNARLQINLPQTDTTEAAFRPLFRDGDVTRLQYLYDRVENIATIDLHITFYCKGDFIKKAQYTDPNNVVQEVWSDSAYEYLDSQGVVQNVPVLRVAPGNKPQPGRPDSGSFTTIGSKQTLLNGDIADYSDQAHIHVNSKRWSPPLHSPLDHRALDVVNRNGLDASYPALDDLKPLSETILHELMHALGGAAPPANVRALITDNPVPPIQTSKIYGYEKCVWMNANRDNPIAIAAGASPLTRADCPTILAKALYLQIKGQATYWSTGVVDTTTLQPTGIQAQTNPKRLAMRMISRFWGRVVDKLQ